MTGLSYWKLLSFWLMGWKGWVIVVGLVRGKGKGNRKL